uniref:Uncharacterized protein n=1 Tax=Arundo donax TaxID=35708 RepID=A0A0A9F4N2_ARUDO
MEQIAHAWLPVWLQELCRPGTGRTTGGCEGSGGGGGGRGPVGWGGTPGSGAAARRGTPRTTGSEASFAAARRRRGGWPACSTPARSATGSPASRSAGGPARPRSLEEAATVTAASGRGRRPGRRRRCP